MTREDGTPVTGEEMRAWVTGRAAKFTRSLEKGFSFPCLPFRKRWGKSTPKSGCWGQECSGGCGTSQLRSHSSVSLGFPSARCAVATRPAETSLQLRHSATPPLKEMKQNTSSRPGWDAKRGGWGASAPQGSRVLGLGGCSHALLRETKSMRNKVLFL